MNTRMDDMVRKITEMLRVILASTPSDELFEEIDDLADQLEGAESADDLTYRDGSGNKHKNGG